MPTLQKNNQISRIIALVFAVRNLMHDKITQKNSKKVSFLQMITLRFIRHKEPTMKEIADYLMITAPSATSLANSLIKDEAVKRREEKGDRRVVRIVITQKGEKYLKEGMECISEKIRKNLEALTPKEQAELAKILEKITNHLRNNKEL
jgi:DNA-binding MarR family transcriptional regulator